MIIFKRPMWTWYLMYSSAPESEDDIHYISPLELVTTLLNHYPNFSKRLNVMTIGKLLNDRGFMSIRKGRNKTTYYEIGKKSEIIKLIESDSEDKISLG